MTEGLRWVSIISGGGTTMEAMIKAAKHGDLKGLVEPVAAIATRAGVDGIARAEALGVRVKVLSRKHYPKGAAGVEAYGQELLNFFRSVEPDVITLNGCLAQMSTDVIYEYPDKMFNQHPGHPQLFGGKDMFGRRVHAAAIIFNRLASRNPPVISMVAQRVAAVYDQGAVVKSAPVEILRTDDVDSLQKRALPIEHQVQIALLKDVVNGSVTEVNGHEVLEPIEQVILFNAREAGKALYPQG